LSYAGYGSYKQAVVVVKNGIPESSDPPEWLTSGEKSTVPGFFSLIKEEEKKFWESFEPNDFLKVYYDHKYNYPHTIEVGYASWIERMWTIRLTPLVETE
jgi:hypothetical protein